MAWVEKRNYIVEDLRDPPRSQVLRYRRKRQGDHLINIAVLRSGKSVATSIWHPKDESKARAALRRYKASRLRHRRKR